MDELLSPQQNPNQIGGPSPVAGPPMPGAMPPMPGAPSPDGAPMPGGPMPGGEASAPASPDQRAELDRLFQGVQTANSKTVTDQLVSRNEVSMMRKELMTKMFELLQQAGVDPGNPESVRAFLDQLQESDPDLLEMFQTAFNGLAGSDLPQDGAPQGDPSQSEPSLMPGAPGGPGGADPLAQMQGMQNLGQ